MAPLGVPLLQLKFLVVPQIFIGWGFVLERYYVEAFLFVFLHQRLFSLNKVRNNIRTPISGKSALTR